jgi:hypothetical protein
VNHLAVGKGIKEVGDIGKEAAQLGKKVWYGETQQK